MVATNGKASKSVSTEAKSFEIITHSGLNTSQVVGKAPRKRQESQNKIVNINLDLDAGSTNCKFVINGEYSDTFPTIFKEVLGELPLGISGCFSIGSKNYAVGQVAYSLNK